MLRQTLPLQTCIPNQVVITIVSRHNSTCLVLLTINCCVSFSGRSTDDAVVGKEMKKHTREPYFLPPDTSEKELAWIFMGSPGPGASLHVS